MRRYSSIIIDIKRGANYEQKGHCDFTANTGNINSNG